MLQTAITQAKNNGGIKIKLPALHFAQRKIKRGMDRFNVVCAGRRFGKDYLAQDRAIKVLSQGKPVGWAAPTYSDVKENYRMLADTLAPIITRKLDNERIEILGGGVLDFWSLASYDRIRGRRYSHFILNECAAFADLLDAWNMVIRPILADMRGGADFYSTPRGLNGFHSLWTQAVELMGWARFHNTTFDNPYIPRDEIDAMRDILPERVYKQEILAEFVEDGAYFQRVLEACTIEKPDNPDYHKGHYIVMGVDWAKSEDYTTFTVACRECNRVVDWERFNQIDFIYQRERLYSTIAKWHNAPVLPERNSIGEPNIEILQQRGIVVLSGMDGKPGFMTTPTTKPPLIEGLAQAIATYNFKLPLDYRDEMTSYQVEMLDSGRSAFGAPSGMHDDRVISAALAWHALGGRTWLIS